MSDAFTELVRKAQQAIDDSNKYWKWHRREVRLESGHGYEVTVCLDVDRCPYHGPRN